MKRRFTMIASVLCVVLGLSAMSPGPDPAMWDGQEKPMMKVDTPAAVIKMVNPYYPESAKKEGIEGVVRVQTLVNTAGVPEKVEILTTDNESSNESAL
jgi:outer membrane biosynthesis protein TonB